MYQSHDQRVARAGADAKCIAYNDDSRGIFREMMEAKLAALVRGGGTPAAYRIPVLKECQK